MAFSLSKLNNMYTSAGLDLKFLCITAKDSVKVKNLLG